MDNKSMDNKTLSTLSQPRTNGILSNNKVVALPKPEEKPSTVRFRKIKLESPEISILSDYSEQHDLVSKSLHEPPLQSRGAKSSFIEIFDEIEIKAEGNKADDKKDKEQAPTTRKPKLLLASIGEVTENELHQKGSLASYNSPMIMTRQNKGLKSTLTSLFKKTNNDGPMGLVADDIHRRQSIFEKGPITPKTNKLLKVLANQASQGKNQEVSKALKSALTKVNPKMLNQAQRSSSLNFKAIKSIAIFNVFLSKIDKVSFEKGE